MRGTIIISALLWWTVCIPLAGLGTVPPQQAQSQPAADQSVKRVRVFIESDTSDLPFFPTLSLRLLRAVPPSH